MGYCSICFVICSAQCLLINLINLIFRYEKRIYKFGKKAKKNFVLRIFWIKKHINNYKVIIVILIKFTKNP